jgi:hypothetical protein
LACGERARDKPGIFLVAGLSLLEAISSNAEMVNTDNFPTNIAQYGGQFFKSNFLLTKKPNNPVDHGRRDFPPPCLYWRSSSIICSTASLPISVPPDALHLLFASI